MKKTMLFTIGLLCLITHFLYADEARISSISGTVMIKSSNTDKWYAAIKNINVKSGQVIKTSKRSRAKVLLNDGSKVMVYDNSELKVNDLDQKKVSFKMILGKLKAWVSKNKSRDKFEVHTPVAVCSVRGTEFSVMVDKEGQTDIEVYKGLVGVRKIDGTGEDIPVGAGERLTVSDARPITVEQKVEALTDEKIISHEVGLEMSKEQVQAAAAQELKLAEYQEGKAMIDVFGYRVRIEEYIMRPAADTFKLVVLNERDNRFDYFYYKGKFNKDLPSDLSIALNDLGGKIGAAAPEYYLTEYEQVYSNTNDYSKDNASGGHLVKIEYNSNGTFTLTDNSSNSNTRTIDAVDASNGAYNPFNDTFDASSDSAVELQMFNPVTDSFETFSTGQTAWKTRFNSYQHILDGARKQWYLRSDSSKNILTADLDGKWIYPSKDSNGNTIYGEWGVYSNASTWPDGDNFHNRIKLQYYDDTYEQYDNYIISDEGKLASFSDFNNITTGAQYKEKLLEWNYQTVITASEFNGRKIDLIVEPKILIKSGIIK